MPLLAQKDQNDVTGEVNQLSVTVDRLKSLLLLSPSDLYIVVTFLYNQNISTLTKSLNNKIIIFIIINKVIRYVINYIFIVYIFDVIIFLTIFL
jgi:hypothetical protein